LTTPILMQNAMCWACSSRTQSRNSCAATIKLMRRLRYMITKYSLWYSKTIVSSSAALTLSEIWKTIFAQWMINLKCWNAPWIKYQNWHSKLIQLFQSRGKKSKSWTPSIRIFKSWRIFASFQTSCNKTSSSINLSVTLNYQVKSMAFSQNQSRPMKLVIKRW